MNQLLTTIKMLKLLNNTRKSQNIRLFSQNYRGDKKRNPQKVVASPAFEKADIDEIFNPDLMRKLFKETGFRYADS